MTSRKWPTAVDLFSGCGGVTFALKRRHFRVVAAVDNDPVACRTFRANHRGVRLFEEDIRNKDLPRRIRRDALSDEDVDLLVVCAPCQPFSSQNRARGSDDRAVLILQAVRFARHLKPKVIFIENVPGLATSAHGGLLEKLKAGLRRIGYQVGPAELVDAADHGVPQRRERCVLLAAKGQAPPRLPAPVTPEGMRVTVKDAIGGLPSLDSGEADPSRPLHRARKHSEVALKRLRKVPKDGGSRDALPNELQLACHVGYGGHPDVYGRMAWSDVAPTLTSGCTDVTKGRFAHPEADRAITMLEAALLQTFPQSYRFFGNAKQIATQIGNAVPPTLVASIVPSVRSSLRGGP